MRLRPSGGKGPLATQWASFIDDQLKEAETWEHMALTRARPVAGDDGLCSEFEKGVTAIIGHKRSSVELRKAVADMRALIAQEKGDSQIWDLKLVRGGMMDIEFIAQYLALNHAHENPGMVHVETADILRAAIGEGLIDPDMGDKLISAHRHYTILMHMFRLATEATFDPQQMAAGVLRRIAGAVDLPDFRFLESNLAEMRANVRGLFEQILGQA
jgi:glutamate-ammonia-ligase adenylyltransferase